MVAFFEQQCFQVDDLRIALSECPHSHTVLSDTDAVTVIVNESDNDDDDDLETEAPELVSKVEDVVTETVTESYVKNCSIM